MSCGYGCSGCGRCQGKGEKTVRPRGFCSKCDTFNSPSSQICKKCGADLSKSQPLRVTPGHR